ncbi:MAG: DNA translocase FtsK, partial [Bacilli bacterium]|nr:DNA translocase FtsK [Bacilli bacterium]
VASQIDSRTILDEGGAEELLGKGDMFANIQGYSPMQRVQGAFVKDEEIDRIVEFICRQGSPEYDQEFMNLEPNASSEQMSFSGEGFSDSSADEFYKQILEFLQSQNSVSVSYLQRKFTIGFPKAARIIDRLEEEGFVGPPNGSKPREVYCDSIRAFLNQ